MGNFSHSLNTFPLARSLYNSKIVLSSVLQLEPKLNADGTPASTRKLTRYAQFIQDNYTDTKKALPQMSHKEIMEALREKYHTQQGNHGSIEREVPHTAS